jgi:hypothetical protein
MARRIARMTGKALDKMRRRTAAQDEKRRDPAEDPASSLLIADAAIRAGSYIVRRSVEKGLLRGRYGSSAARDLLSNRTLGQTVISFGLAKLATRSLPGAVIVGTGAVAKSLYDRRRAKRKKARQQGDASISAQGSDDQP